MKEINLDLFKGINPKIVEQFLNYHKNNPKVYELFIKFSNELYDKRILKYSSKAIFEIIRWHTAISTSGDIYKMNNNYSSCYSRILQHEDPKFVTFFSTRKGNK